MTHSPYAVWKDVFSSNDIYNINKVIEEKYFANETKEYGTEYKNVSSVKLFYYRDIKHLIGNFLQQIYQHSAYSFGYNVFPYNDFNVLRHSTYDSKDKADYDWHNDSSGSQIYDTKLTLLINVSSEAYEGGEFQILDGKNPQTINDFNSFGSAFLFQSHVLHKVLPVTSGIRKSIAYFIEGPKFQ